MAQERQQRTRAFPPVQTSGITKLTARGPLQEAKALLAGVRNHFSSEAANALPKAAEKDGVEKALNACFYAISAWRSIARQSKPGSGRLLESHLALGELYYKRGMLCRGNHERLVHEMKSVGIWLQRSAEAFETSLMHFGRARGMGKGKRWFDEPELDKEVRIVHEEAAHSCIYAAIYLHSGETVPYPLPKIELLKGFSGKAGKYGRKYIFHRAESGK